MSDTRTIYLHTADTIFTSDPTDTDYTYLDMSDYDSLNPEYSSTVRTSAGVTGIYEDYNVKMTLTFTGENSGRDERADWVNKYGHNINQISVATTPSKINVFNKSANVTSIEMIDTEYVNGAMVVITLTLFGRWQSNLENKSVHFEEYSGGTKKYYMTYHVPDFSKIALTNYAYTDFSLTDTNLDISDDVEVTDTTATFKVRSSAVRDMETFKYSYDYKYGTTIVKNEITFPNDKNRFLLILNNQYQEGVITLSNGVHSVTINNNNLSNYPSISSDLITYTNDTVENYNRFTLLDKGYVASTVWDNITDDYASLYSIINSLNMTPANINVTNEAGQHIPFSLFVYSVQDFI